MKKEFSHFDKNGRAKMVDVSLKRDQSRIAEATGFITLQSGTLHLIKQISIDKGDVLTVAQMAGIMAAKKTSDLIPLCHPLLLTKVEVDTLIEDNGIRVNSRIKCDGKTGVEMEALIAVQIALLTIYDMCKAVDNSMIIENVRLIRKEKKNK